MKRYLGSAALLLLPVLAVFAQDDPPGPAVVEPEWQLHALDEAFEVAEGDVLSLRHVRGDVRIEATDTDRIHVKGLAQYRADDPRVPAIRFVAGVSGAEPAQHRLTVDFADLEIVDNEAWAKRRIDVALLVPRHLRLEIETDDDLIEAKDIVASARLTSLRGAIRYDGTGDLVARSERGPVRALLRRTREDHTVALSTLASDIHCVLLDGARAAVALETRGSITTDYSVEIDREAGSPFKKGRARIGEGGTALTLVSTNGNLHLQGLIAPE